VKPGASEPIVIPDKLRSSCNSMSKRFRNWLIQQRQVLDVSSFICGYLFLKDDETWEELVNLIIAKCRLLLRFRPLPTITSLNNVSGILPLPLKRAGSEPEVEKRSSKSNLLKTNPQRMLHDSKKSQFSESSKLVGIAQEAAAQSRYFLIWNYIQQRKRAEADIQEERIEEQNLSVLSALLAFLQSPMAMEDALSILEGRRARLQSRKEGLHVFHNMITTVSVPFVRDAVFKLFPTALQQIKSRSLSASKDVSVPIWDNIKVMY
jgi:hypothetical protein